MQSMLQSQVMRFGKHVFKEGSIVLPGAFTIRSATTGTLNQGPGNPIDYVKISDVDTSNNIIDVQNYINQVFKGQTSNLSAYVIDVLGSDGTTKNTNTLYVSYLGASPGNPTLRTFVEGETLISSNAGSAIVMSSANTTDPIGKASWFQIEQGVFFAKDHFIYFPTQSVVLDRYGSLPTCKVGFYVQEQIVNYTQDSSLLDPALESTNYSAPGADRFKLVSRLEVLPIEDAAGAPDFVPLFTIKDGVIQTLNEQTEYNILGDVMAQRTDNESGDYVVQGLTVQISEHDKVYSPIPNYGRYDSGNNMLLVATVDPGIGYVRGYRVRKYDRTDVEFTKPMNYNNVSSQLALTTMGQYVVANEFVGTWRLDQGVRINLYDLPQKRITDQKWSISAQTGNNIGSAIVNSVQYVSGNLGYDAIYNIYLSDIKMTGSNSFSNVASLYIQNSPYASSGADIVGASSNTANTELKEVGKSTLLYYVGSNSIRNLRDQYNDPQTLYYFYRTEGTSTTLYFDTTGTTTIALSGSSNFELPYGTTTLTGLSDNEVKDDITVTCCESFNIGPLFSGAVVSKGATANVLSGVSTYFTYFNVGDKIQIAGQANTWYIESISNNTSMRLSNTISASVTGNAIFKVYKVGDIISMAGVGVTAGAQRQIETTPSTLTLKLQETLPQDIDATVSYKIATKTSLEALKTLRPNRIVKISTATAGTNGPFSLGFADVYKINKIVKKTGSAPSSLTDGDDVTKYFTLDNGQRDTHYEIARIVKSKTLSLGASDYLLISLDYFEPNFSGRSAYFSVDSYPVEDNDEFSSNSTIRTETIPVYTSPTTGYAYDLRNYIDFRPVKKATANDSTVISSISTTTNPSNNSTTYQFSTGGMLFPVPSSQLEYDYSYYLGRADIVTINKDGTISVKEGQPSNYSSPIVPDPLESQMILAIVNVPPYPSLSPAYGNALKRKDLACKVRKASNRVYTMRDIGVLDKRISALEYYTSLTLLEKDALNLKILDDQGLDRFKNGIFIDTFRDHALSARGVDKDYRIVVDPRECSIRPLFSTNSIGYEYISGSGVDVTVHNNNLVTLNYTEELQFTQPRVTETRNLEKGTFFFQGTLQLYPNQDVWVDTSFAPDEVVDINVTDGLVDVDVTGPDTINQQGSVTKSLINTEWENWKTTVIGYNLYKGEGASKTFVGFFTTEEAAKAAAAAWLTQPGNAADYTGKNTTNAYNDWLRKNGVAGAPATIETLYNNTRSGVNYFANISADSAVGGPKLISSETIDYIRPQKIGVQALNLKGYSKMTVFFDDVNVSQFCTPLNSAQFNTFIAGNPVPADANGNYPEEGDELIVDDYGALYFLFRIPDDPKFRCGQRKLVIVDTLNINAQTISDTNDTSTSATGIFFAQGTAQTLQRTVYSTQGYLETTEEIDQSYDSNSFQVLPNEWKPPPKGHCCFDPDAKILMANCTLKAIKDVVEGDEVIGHNGKVNKVLKNKQIGVGGRKMLKLKGANFYTTDDHLFLTKKGWKTWRPDVVLGDTDTLNGSLLVGDNRYNSIDKADHLKTLKIKDNYVLQDFVSYEEVEAEEFEFDPTYKVYDLTLDGNMTYVVDGYVVHNCCVAYSVLIRAPDDEEGIFCTGFDIYVARKSRTRGLWFEIGEMSTTGQVTNSRVPGTQVWFNNDEIPVSNTGGDYPLQIRFPSPVFLMNKKPYAFIVHSDSPNPFDVDPDTQLWISRLGQIDKITEAPVVDRQGTGQYWQTTNNVNWYEEKDIDLKMDIYRAKFEIGSGTFIIGNDPVERLHLTDISQSIIGKKGEHFSSGDLLTLTSANGSISIGDRLKGNISLNKANGTVLSSPSTNKYLMSNTKYVIGEKIDVYSGGSYAGVSAVVSTLSNATAVLSYVSETSSNVYTEWIESTGGFKPNTTIKIVGNNSDSFKANVYTVSDYNYSVVNFEPRVLDFIKTDLKYLMDTYDEDAVTSTGYTPVYASETQYFDTQKVLRSKSNEIDQISGDHSNKVLVTMQTLSEYVSPVFDLNTTQTIYIENLINANTSGENDVSGGQALNKYISQVTVLAEGQDAEDLRVYLTAYRPPTTDVKVYVKIIHASDNETLRQKKWIELEKESDGDSTYSSIADRNNFREYSYTFSTTDKNSDGVVKYTAGSYTFTGFKYFAIKIVLVADNPAVVPRVADLRVIALQI